jgi:hypothetical protein
MKKEVYKKGLFKVQASPKFDQAFGKSITLVNIQDNTLEIPPMLPRLP